MVGSGSIPWRIVFTFPLVDSAEAARDFVSDDSEWTSGTYLQIDSGRGL